MENDKSRAKTDIEVIKLFSCSTQLSMEFQLLIKSVKGENIIVLPSSSQMLYLAC